MWRRRIRSYTEKFRWRLEGAAEARRVRAKAMKRARKKSHDLNAFRLRSKYLDKVIFDNDGPTLHKESKHTMSDHIAPVPPATSYQIQTEGANWRKFRRSKNPKRKKQDPSTLHTYTFTSQGILLPRPTTATATFITTSSTSRRQRRNIEIFEVPSPPPSFTPLELIDSGDDNHNDDYPLPFRDLLGKEIADEAATKPRARRYLSSVSIAGYSPCSIPHDRFHRTNHLNSGPWNAETNISTSCCAGRVEVLIPIRVAYRASGRLVQKPLKILSLELHRYAVGIVLAGIFCAKVAAY